MWKKVQKYLIKCIPWLLVAALGITLIYLQRPQPPINSNEYLVPTKTYRQPIFNLPFIKSKQPIKDADLPIPKSEVATTIEIWGEGSESLSKRFFTIKAVSYQEWSKVPENRPQTLLGYH